MTLEGSTLSAIAGALSAIAGALSAIAGALSAIAGALSTAFGAVGPITHCLSTAGLSLLFFLASTVVFDVVHHGLHCCAEARSALLQRVGSLHAAHHAFLDRQLRIHPELLARNLRLHVIPEFGTQLAVSLVGLLMLPPTVVLPAMGLQILVFLLILRARGMDINHVEVERLTAYRPLYFCTPPYHCLHHLHPHAYFSSWIKAWDHIAGTGVDLRDRRFAILDAECELGAELRRLLEIHHGGAIQLLSARAPGAEPLADVDVLILCGDGVDHEAWIDAFERAARARRFPIEVWSVVASPPARAATERAARRHYTDRRLIYRHIPSRALDGPAGRSAARTAFFFIRRGFNWVPTRFAPGCVLDYLRFRLRRTSSAAA